MSSLHRQGITHGGLDPSNVAYVGNALDEDEQQPPLLTNVGLMHAFRWYVDPAEYLDPATQRRSTSTAASGPSTT
ncbi:hypothetical protein VB773_16205 [Haloarculaceae archaeon H-GB2-1]|nr:hypothetical protein [Haloarculaceae archaeon H-GB2-1]